MLPQEHPRFGHQLRILIEEKLPEYLTGIGNVNLRAFSESVQGYQYETIRKAAVGEREPTIELLEAVAKALDVPPDTFYEYELLSARRAFDPNVVGLDAALDNVRLWLEVVREQDKRRGASRKARRSPSGAIPNPA